MKKLGLKGLTKITFFLVLIFFSLFVYNYINFISAESSATIWTTDVNENQKTDFAPYTKVYIHGSNFLENHKIDVSITRPDNVVEEGFTFSDYYGSFVYDYQLDGIEGLYNVLATDKTNTAETTFTDAIHVNLDQWANKDAEWQNGNLNPSNSEYHEGEAVPFRLIMTGLPGGSHYIHINYDFTAGGIYAYDFLTRFDLSESPNISADTSETLPAGPINNYTIPSDTFDDVSLHELPASDRYFSIIGGSITNIEAITHSGDVSGNSEADMIVNFTTGTCTVDCKIFLLWGGHLASELDWGTGNGSSSISGSPFHMRTQSLDGGGQKNQDRSIQPGAVLPPPECITNEDCDDGNVCTLDECIDDACVHTPEPLSTPCEADEQFCTVDHCDGQGSCVYWKDYDCDDSVICTDDSCNETTDSCDNVPNDGNCPSDTECADHYCDQLLDCQVNYDPLSTPCEADDDKCTHDHCDGSGSCVWNYDEPVPDPEECKSFYCDPVDGLIKEDYSDYPWSTSCELDDDLCTIDHCDGSGSCVWKEDVYVPPAEECVSYYCDPFDGIVYPIYEDYSTFCELDDDLCTIDHCDGAGSCVYLDDVDCSALDNQCQVGVCDPSDGGCYPDYYDYSTSCNNDLYCDGPDHCDGSGNCVNLGPTIDCTYLDDKCQEGVCNEVSDQCEPDYSTYPLSYPCEADDDKCTHDHCDGIGSCVWNYDEPVPPAEDCRNFYCDPSDGIIKPNNYDYSTFCELDDDLCTVDHCDGSGSCVLLHDTYQDVPPAEQCAEYYCDPADGIIYPDYSQYPLSTPCETDGDYCTEDHCDGSGACVLEYDHYQDVPDPEECKSFYCDPVDGLIKEDYSDYPLSTECELDDDLCTHDHCDGAGACIWNYDEPVPDPEPCVSYYCDPFDGIVYPIYEDYSTPCELDDDLCTIDHCDGSGSCVWLEDVVVPPAEACRDFSCNPSTGEVEVNNYPNSTFCELDDNPCTVDHCNGEGYCVFLEDYYKNISLPSKVVGDPKFECDEGEWCEWRITMATAITLSCEEGTEVKWRYALDGDWKWWHTDESPVTIYFPEESNHTLEVYCADECNEGPIDSENFKVEGTKFEIPLFKKWNLISVPFVLLDDNPEVVFDKIFFDGELVENTSDYIDSVWAYDPELVICGQPWCVWSPGEAPDDLRILPGWGYWILVTDKPEEECGFRPKCFWHIHNEEPLWMVIGGSLFSPAVTPPSRELQEGWNLIGYYGTKWEEYDWGDFDFMCGDKYKFPDKWLYGDKVYCALNSLVDTQEGFPRWSSLWSYINCGNHNTDWLGLNACIDPSPFMAQDRMYAGRGYWLELDVADIYAPATNCIWNTDFECVWTGGVAFP